MNAECVVPDWLHDVFLGYGSPGAAHYKEMPNYVTHLDFNDTFLSFPHLVDSFPDYQVKVHQWVGLCGMGVASWNFGVIFFLICVF